jgi:hypothetical protein
MNAVLSEPEGVAIEAGEPAQAAASSVAMQPGPRPRRRSEGALVFGELVGLLEDGCTALVVRVDEGGATKVVRARSLVELTRTDLGRRAALMFEDGDPLTPILIGVLRDGSAPPLTDPAARQHVELSADGVALTVSAREKLVLRCGAASITLTKAGKVLIQGAYVVSHATGVNRVRGGSVQIN